MADISWLMVLGFLVLTFNSSMVVYRSNGDTGSIIFVVASYADLDALFGCLRYYERLDRHSPKCDKVNATVWGLTTLLTVIFSYKVVEIMPLAIKLVAWAMATTTSCGGFYAFFIHEEKPEALPMTATEGTPDDALKEGLVAN